MTKEQRDVAAMYLRSAASSVDTYGAQASGAILAARVYALLAYKEGELESLISDIRNEAEKGKI
jgi:hypothetical protein